MEKNIKRIQVTQFNFQSNEIDGKMFEQGKLPFKVITKFLNDQINKQILKSVDITFLAKGLISGIPETIVASDLTSNIYKKVIADLANKQKQMILYLLNYDEDDITKSSLIGYIYDGSGLYTYYLLRTTQDEELNKDYGDYRLFKCHTDQIVDNNGKVQLPDFYCDCLFGENVNAETVITDVATFKTHYGLQKLVYEDNNGSWILPLDQQEQALTITAIPIAGFTLTLQEDK